MARQQKLKVFRTPIGFHDAYVAAPSQKAALEAWGSNNNLFASGAAERVEDPELTREPLANPGKVIRRVRGTMAEHIAALHTHSPRSVKKNKRAASPEPGDDVGTPTRKTKTPVSHKPNRPPKPKPWPQRDALSRAEAELMAVEERHDQERANIVQRQAELDHERRKLEDAQARERQSFERRVKAARAKYERAMAAWRAD